MNSIANHPTRMNVMSIGCNYGPPWYISDPHEYLRIYDDPLLNYGSPYSCTPIISLEENSFIIEIHNSMVGL